MSRNLNMLMTKNLTNTIAWANLVATIWAMYATDTILSFAFPFGRFGGTRCRLSFFFPVLALALMWRLQSPQFGVLATAIVFFSVLIHELAHLVVARSTGGNMDEIKLWPLGGLSEPYGRGYLSDHVQTMMAGPIANLLLALSCLLTLSTAEIAPLLNPFVRFSIPAGEALDVTAWRLAFLTNWTLFLVNLLPITPFDGGVLMRTYLTTRFTEPESRDLMIRLGLIAAIFGLFTGFVFDLSGLIAVSAFVLVLQIHDNLRWHEIAGPMESLSHYDALEMEASNEFPEPWFDQDDSIYNEESSESEVLDRWRSQREQERLHQEQEERQQEEEQVDRILEKLHQGGRESLSSSELHLLNRVSDRYRNREQHS